MSLRGNIDLKELIDALLKGTRWKVRTITAAETLPKEDTIILVDNATAFTLNLPDATLAENLGRIYLIMKHPQSALPTLFFNVDGFGTQLIGRLEVQELLKSKDFLLILCDGNNWQILKDGRERGSLVAHWTDISTLTNIGTAYVQVYGTLTGQEKKVLIETAGFTQVRMIVNWIKVGTGTQNVRILAGVTTLVSKDCISGDNDSGWVDIPTNLLYVTAQDFFLQAKSTVATDDPVFHGCYLLMR